MRYLAAAIVLFIGVSADIAVYTAATSASAAAPFAHAATAGATAHKLHAHLQRQANPSVWSH